MSRICVCFLFLAYLSIRMMAFRDTVAYVVTLLAALEPSQGR